MTPRQQRRATYAFAILFAITAWVAGNALVSGQNRVAAVAGGVAAALVGGAWKAGLFSPNRR
jgi:hypothetical protein